MIQRVLLSYAQYGPDNPFNYELTDEELDSLTADKLLASLRELMSYQFKILYYGPKTNKEIATQLSSLIEIDGEINAMPKNKVYKQREIKNNEERSEEHTSELQSRGHLVFS